MSDQRRFRAKRDDFKKRFDEGNNSFGGEDDELDEQYRILRRKHREFEQTHGPRKPKAEGGFRKGGDFKKGGFKKDGFKKREGGFRKGGDFKKKGGFGGKKREGGFGK